MERRVLLAVFLCFLVLYLWQAMFVPVPTPPAGTAPTPAAPPPAAAPDSAASPPAPEGGPAAPETAPMAAPIVAAAAERDIRVETQDVIAVFTNRGARLKSWRLKRYLDREKQPQELIENEAGGHPLPFTLKTADEQVNTTLNSALFTVSGVPGDGAASAASLSAPAELRFEYRDSAGVHAVKEFRLEPTSYVLALRASVTAGDRTLPAAIVWGPALGDHIEASSLVQGAQGLLFQNGEAERLTAGDVRESPVYEGNFRYAGVDDNYFMTVALDPGPSRVSYQPVTIAAGPAAAERVLMSYTLEPLDNAGAATFFIGPKELDVLTRLDPEFASAINFGRFAVIVVPLLQSLKWVHGYVGNWGWSIVILTAIINLVLAPLRHKQVVSMRKMQELQPEVKAIQDRYKKYKATDPAKQKMNQEMMTLYREKKVNPASGCIPVLLTFPIMIAMWAALQVSIELRGAPWFGWIQDLSAPDPWYLLPIMMVGTQFWQQHITPMSGMDPAQQKMMKFMPLLLGFIFFSLPSGALLYYVAGTLIGIGQQYLTNYLIGPPIVRAVRPPAERRVKRKESGGVG